MLTIKAEFKLTKKMLRQVREKDIPAARRLALNRAARSARTAGVRTLARVAGVKQKDVRKRFSVAPARGNKGWKAEKAAVYFRPYVYGDAGKIKLRQTGTGVTAGGAETPGAFIPGAIEGSPNRKNKAFQRVRSTRYPLRVAKIELPPDVRPPVVAAVKAKAKEVFKGRFKHEFNRLVEKRALGAKQGKK